MESLLGFVIGVQFLHQCLASNAVRPKACSEVYEYRSWMRGCRTDNIASSGLCPEACLQLASTILWTQAGLDIVHDYCYDMAPFGDRSLNIKLKIRLSRGGISLLSLQRIEFDRLIRQVWMLTGDKLETATCIAKSSRLVSRNQSIHVFKPVSSRADAHLELNSFRRKQDCCLVITGEALEVCSSILVVVVIHSLLYMDNIT